MTDSENEIEMYEAGEYEDLVCPECRRRFRLEIEVKMLYSTYKEDVEEEENEC